MDSHARVVVIGGGVVGCSILFHLAKMGWKDLVLLERRELTCGSTWHAAGQIHTINANSNLSSLQGYTLRFYPELEKLSGQSCSLHRTGVIYLASTSERLDYLKQERGKARHLGFDIEFISLDEVKRLNPLINTEHFLGALFDPLDGHLDPAGTVQAYAKAARDMDAKIYRQTKVEYLRQRSDGTWNVITTEGDIHAEVVVNAGGLWAREVGRMVGIELPIQAMEHHYLITEPLEELQGLDHEVPGVIDFEGNVYTRQEGEGLLIGTYEANCVPWAVDSTPWDFGDDLLPPDLERIAGRLEVAFERIPALATAGIKRVVNGPFTFAPDGNPLVGPIPGMRNFYVACGVMAGFCQGAGIGRCLAEWIIEGEPSIDVFAMDVARFGDFATRHYTLEKVKENFGRRFMLTYPNEELPTMRPWRTTPLYDRFKQSGAVFGAAHGLEHVLWFAPEDVEPVEIPTFRRSNAFAHVAEECGAVREGIGLIELANYAKYEITGPGAEEWLDRLLANQLPPANRLRLTPMLSPKGRLLGDLTVGRLADDHFYIFGSGLAQQIHMRWFLQNLPDQGVTVRNRSSELLGIGIAGPKSRELLSRLTREDVSSEGLRFLDLRQMDIAGVPSLVARISFTGELGYEIYCTPEYQLALYEAIMMAGEDMGVQPFGARALMSMRLEKSFGVWTLDFRPDFTPAESGLDVFVDYNKEADFIGKPAAAAERAKGPEKKLVTLVVEAVDADVNRDEPILYNGECVGYATSGGFAHYTQNSVALGYVPTELAKDGTAFEVEILGNMRSARIQVEPLYDPKGECMRS